MVKIRKFIGPEVFVDGLDDQLVELDKLTMGQILSDAGVTFPEEMRRKGFEGNPTIFVASVNSATAGYLQYCRSWDNENDIYISSIQILPKYRSGPVLLALLNAARESLLNEEFDKLVTEVLKNNIAAIRLYEKLGFKLNKHPQKQKYLSVSGTKSMLKNKRVLKILSRHNKALHRIKSPCGRSTR
ncbi:MAG: GNAT family N-acetyltransferase [Gammaproteobacteria bacterium]|nr:GNAT family N-acetyltransferase [Gammaproteobacteria bacterium]